jgi:hypothetical protein
MRMAVPQSKPNGRMHFAQPRLLCDELETPGMCSFFRFHKAFAAHVMFFLCI